MRSPSHTEDAVTVSERRSFLEEIDRMIATASNLQRPHKAEAVAGGSAEVRDDEREDAASSRQQSVALKELTDQVYRLCGRRPRVLLASFHTSRNATRREDELAPTLADVGFDVDISPAARAPADIARMAVEADVHAVVVLSTKLTDDEQEKERTLVLALQDALKPLGADEEILLCFVGGVGKPGATTIDAASASSAASSSTLVFPSSTTPLDLAQAVLKTLLRPAQ